MSGKQPRFGFFRKPKTKPVLVYLHYPVLYRFWTDWIEYDGIIELQVVEVKGKFWIDSSGEMRPFACYFKLNWAILVAASFRLRNLRGIHVHPSDEETRRLKPAATNNI